MFHINIIAMANWYCNSCGTYKDSWAEHQSHKPNETYRRDIRCWSCDRWSLTYTDSQKARYKELVRERTSISGSVEEVERFSTWWSNNIATAVVYRDGYYRVFLLVYDPIYSTYKPAVFPESYDCSYWGDNSRRRGSHNYSSDAKSEASWLRGELIGDYGKYSDNPILLIHPACDCTRSFTTFVTEPYVTKNYGHLKPFDVVTTDKSWNNIIPYKHVGVYLGRIDEDSKVCHFTQGKNDTTIDPWGSFLDGEVIGYHSVIPFKNYKDISKQIVWAKDNNFRKGHYNLANRNCEHFASMIVYGIDFSQQVHENREKLIARAIAHQTGISAYGVATATGSIVLAPFTFGLSLIPGAVAAVASIGASFDNLENHCVINSDKTSICLVNEIRDTDNRLGKKSDWETEKYQNKYLQEVPPKENCRIM